MLISIITVVKNDLVRLKKTISSLNYIYNDINFEHVIIDGSSIDNTLPFLKNLKRKNNNIIIDNSLDVGIYDAMNRGYELSRGDFIIFLNAGDKLIANKKHLINTLKKFMKTDINIICFPFKHELSGQSILRYPKLKNKDKLPTSHQAMFFSNSFLENNKYSLDYKFASDFDLYLRSDRKNITIISEYEPISVVEFDGVATENCNYLIMNIRRLYQKGILEFLKFFILIKINVKFVLIILLKKYLLKI